MLSSDESGHDLATTWQAVLRHAVRSLDELAALLELAPETLRPGAAAAAAFPLLVPRGFIDRIEPRNARDPLLLQVLPDALESAPAEGFGPDPLREPAFAAGGVIRKYPSRALVVTTGACPVHCRYCFRRSFPYNEHNAARHDWGPALASLNALPGTREVILSGGDPLTLTDRRLEALLDRICALPGIETLRIHTRFPIMIPERITPRLIRLLRNVPVATVVVVHANHPNEIDEHVAAALRKLGESATAALNQSVLLRGVNDDPETLGSLSRRLFANGILPYYLHALDRVAGAAHFLVDDAVAMAIVEQLRQSLPGYLVPKFVREIPGRLSKTPVS